jgi:hypothetical protein
MEKTKMLMVKLEGFDAIVDEDYILGMENAYTWMNSKQEYMVSVSFVLKNGTLKSYSKNCGTSKQEVNATLDYLMALKAMYSAKARLT